MHTTFDELVAILDDLWVECDRLVDKHVGRARADFRAQLEQAAHGLRTDVSTAFADMTAGLRTGHQAALDFRACEAPRCEHQRLVRERDALAGLVERLAGMTTDVQTKVGNSLEGEAL